MQFSVRMELHGKCMTSIFPYIYGNCMTSIFGQPGLIKSRTNKKNAFLWVTVGAKQNAFSQLACPQTK